MLFSRLVFVMSCIWSIINSDSSLIQEKNVEPDEINAVDSDYFLIVNGPSTLPVNNIGSGVFAKVNIPNGGIICEYRGPIIAEKDMKQYYTATKNDKLFDIIGPDGEKYHIIGQNLCAYINDCTSIMNSSYTPTELVILKENSKLDDSNSGTVCYDGFSYNAKPFVHRETGNN